MAQDVLTCLPCLSATATEKCVVGGALAPTDHTCTCVRPQNPSAKHFHGQAAPDAAAEPSPLYTSAPVNTRGASAPTKKCLPNLDRPATAPGQPIHTCNHLVNIHTRTHTNATNLLTQTHIPDVSTYICKHQWAQHGQRSTPVQSQPARAAAQACLGLGGWQTL